MRWIATPEKDTANAALEWRLAVAPSAPRVQSREGVGKRGGASAPRRHGLRRRGRVAYDDSGRLATRDTPNGRTDADRPRVDGHGLEVLRGRHARRPAFGLSVASGDLHGGVGACRAMAESSIGRVTRHNPAEREAQLDGLLPAGSRVRVAPRRDVTPREGARRANSLRARRWRADDDRPGSDRWWRVR